MYLHSTRIDVFTNLPEMKAKLGSPKQTLVSMPVDRAGNGAEAAGRDSKVWKYVPDRQTEPSTCGTFGACSRIREASALSESPPSTSARTTFFASMKISAVLDFYNFSLPECMWSTDFGSGRNWT